VAVAPWSSACAFVDDPDAAVAFIAKTGNLYGIHAATVAHADSEKAIVWITAEPPVEALDEGYPIERFSIVVWRSGRILAIPHNAAGRTWIHRFSTLLGELCIFYPRDPRQLRWEWSDGLVDYVMLVYRHLLCEEFARRNDDQWPVEDAPHGPGPHPILTEVMQRAAGGVA
jgi:hypothetical protein